MTTTHAFTESGLGQAPFRFVGFDEEPDGCRHCGTGIRNRFHIVSADGVHSVVGSTCIEKTGDQGLIDIAKAEKNRRAREKAHIKRQAEAEAAWVAKVQAQRDRNGGLSDWEQEEAKRAAELAARQPVIELLAPIADDLEDGRGGFRDSVARDLRDGHLPTANACEIVVDILAKQAGRRNTDAHKAEAARVEAVLAKAGDTA